MKRWKALALVVAGLVLVGIFIGALLSRAAHTRYSAAVVAAKSRGIAVSFSDIEQPVATTPFAEFQLGGLSNLPEFDRRPSEVSEVEYNLAAAEASSKFLPGVLDFIERGTVERPSQDNSGGVFRYRNIIKAVSLQAWLATYNRDAEEALFWLEKGARLVQAFRRDSSLYTAEAARTMLQDQALDFARKFAGEPSKLDALIELLRSSKSIDFLPHIKKDSSAIQQATISQVAHGLYRENVRMRLGPVSIDRPVKPFEATDAAAAALEMRVEIVDAWDNEAAFEEIMSRRFRTRRSYSDREAAHARDEAKSAKLAGFDSEARRRAVILIVAATLIRAETGAWPTLDELENEGYETTDPRTKTKFELRFDDPLPVILAPRQVRGRDMMEDVFKWREDRPQPF